MMYRYNKTSNGGGSQKTGHVGYDAEALRGPGC